jgi:hypothetical protein
VNSLTKFLKKPSTTKIKKNHETRKDSSKLDNFATYAQDEELNQKQNHPKC